MRGRTLLVLSLAVVAVGVLAALGAMYLDPARAAVGPMPGLGRALPAETRILTGLDVRRFVASPFYQRYGRRGQGRPQVFTELQARTGIDPERDVDQVLIASQGVGARLGATAIIIGRFNRLRTSGSLARQRNVVARTQDGVQVYVFNEGVRGSSALAFLGDDALVMGSEPEVVATVGNHAHSRDGLKGNAELMALVQSVRPGATFWTVGDQSVLSQMPATLPGPGGGSFSLPGLKSLVVTGDLEPVLSFEAIAGANDEAAARQLADVVRGLIALATLQAGQKPELQRLASSITVTTEAARVRLNGRIPYELLDAVMPKGMATAPATPGPAR